MIASLVRKLFKHLLAQVLSACLCFMMLQDVFLEPLHARCGIWGRGALQLHTFPQGPFGNPKDDSRLSASILKYCTRNSPGHPDYQVK